jgi:H+/Cl- antiporter ClcA
MLISSSPRTAQLLLLISLLVAGLVVGIAVIPIAWIAELGFALQSRWPLNQWLIPTATLLLGILAWGPLSRGRGGGVTGLLALQEKDLSEANQDRAIHSLDLAAQLQRLALLLLTHLGGVTVGIESPSASMGASVALALTRLLPNLKQIPPALLGSIGCGAGLAAAFQAPLLGVAYAFEELSRQKNISLVLPTMLMAASATLINSGMGRPAHGHEQLSRLDWASLDNSLYLVPLAALLGVLFLWALVKLAPLMQALFRKRTLVAAVFCALVLYGLAVWSQGASLNDGQLLLSASLIADQPSPPMWLLLPRFVSSLVSISMGAPGGLMHDAMTLGALMGASSGTTAAALAAASLFAATQGTPLFCALFVLKLSTHPDLAAPLLAASAFGCWISEWLGPQRWNHWQVNGFLAGTKLQPSQKNA